MTSNEFVLWLKGFTEGVHEFNITPKQWDIICEHLEKVELPQRLSRYTLDVDTSNSNWTTTTITADGRNDVTYKTDNLETKTILND